MKSFWLYIGIGLIGSAATFLLVTLFTKACGL